MKTKTSLVRFFGLLALILAFNACKVEKFDEPNLNANDPEITYQVTGQITDFITNAVISDATITIDDAEIGLNEDGEFDYSSTNDFSGSEIIVSAPGYLDYNGVIDFNNVTTINQYAVKLSMIEEAQLVDAEQGSEYEIANGVKVTIPADNGIFENGIEKENAEFSISMVSPMSLGDGNISPNSYASFFINTPDILFEKSVQIEFSTIFYSDDSDLELKKYNEDLKIWETVPTNIHFNKENSSIVFELPNTIQNKSVMNGGNTSYTVFGNAITYELVSNNRQLYKNYSFYNCDCPAPGSSAAQLNITSDNAYATISNYTYNNYIGLEELFSEDFFSLHLPGIINPNTLGSIPAYNSALVSGTTATPIYTSNIAYSLLTKCKSTEYNLYQDLITYKFNFQHLPDGETVPQDMEIYITYTTTLYKVFSPTLSYGPDTLTWKYGDCPVWNPEGGYFGCHQYGCDD